MLVYVKNLETGEVKVKRLPELYVRSGGLYNDLVQCQCRELLTE